MYVSVYTLCIKSMCIPHVCKSLQMLKISGCLYKKITGDYILACMYVCTYGYTYAGVCACVCTCMHSEKADTHVVKCEHLGNPGGKMYPEILWTILQLLCLKLLKKKKFKT